MVDVRPCKGENTNICVGEGCFGEACRQVYGPDGQVEALTHEYNAAVANGLHIKARRLDRIIRALTRRY